MTDPAAETDTPQRPLAGRRRARPSTVEPCPECGAFLGRDYPRCATCHEVVERYWHADWMALLAAEGSAPGSDDERLLAEVVVAELERHPWTVVDYALTLLRCPECGAEWGGGPPACAACAMAFGNLWAPGLEAGATMNEHALRVGRWVMRHPHRHSATAVAGWRLSLPLLLAGALPTTAEAQRINAWLKAGGVAATLSGYRTFAEIAAQARRNPEP